MTLSSQDILLGFRTRDKIAQSPLGDASNLRRTVLLCNTYDAFQRSMTKGFTATRSRSPPPARTEKPVIQCREIEIVDDDYDSDEGDDDDDAAGVESDLDSVILSKAQPSSGDDLPPPYETLSTLRVVNADSLPVAVDPFLDDAVFSDDDGDVWSDSDMETDDDDEDDDDDDENNHNAWAYPRAPSAYTTTSHKRTGILIKDVSTRCAAYEPNSSSAQDTKRVVFGALPSRGACAQSSGTAHGVLEVH